MMRTTFLDKLVQQLNVQFPNGLTNVHLVLPNKRAKVFLLDELKKQSSVTFFAPQIISIEDFVQNIAGIRSIDAIELLFAFYEVYLSITETKDQQDFDTFSNWAKTLLQDFNEIDRYLLHPNDIFSYLQDIEAIKRWDLQPENTTDLIDKYLHFWHQMPVYYLALYEYLLQQGLGYQGMIYREAVDNLHHFSNTLTEKHFVFAGFNALNQAEEKIFQHLLAIDKATVLWDAEEFFVNDPFHDAGLFARKIKSSWSYYKSNPYEWISNHYNEPKNISIIGTPKAIGQTKIVGDILHNFEGESLSKVAIVLGEENLLIPLLHALPSNIESLNITMGFSAKNNPAQLLIQKLFKLHSAALSRKGSSYVFYYKDILEILSNPLIEPYVGAQDVVSKITKYNYTFITRDTLFGLQNEHSELFSLLFAKWDGELSVVLDGISEILQRIKAALHAESKEERITLAFVYAVFKIINKLNNYISQSPHITTVESLYEMYKQVVDLAEVSFEGEPLEGLQIMGILESRVLDFDTVIITSLNEGTFPAGKSQNSFIPYDVKRERGLPTYKEKDAIYTYHFYHLIQRAKNVYLLYNTESEGIDAGEKSRFITQLEVEARPNHIITHTIFNPLVPEIASIPMEVHKSESLLSRLRQIAEIGFSPSSLTAYIRNPIQFYFQRVLRISDTEEVEENIAVNTLGTVIHESLKELYTPYVNTFLRVEDVETMLQKYDAEIYTQFRIIYREGVIDKGRNLLAYEVAKRNVYNFLQFEKRLLLEGDAVKILHLEQSFDQVLEDDRLVFPVKIKGEIDRIEQRNGKIRIIDYKSGKVEQRHLEITDWKGLTLDIKNEKIIQLLCYVFMIRSHYVGQPIEAGIISFKNLKSGFMPFRIKEGREVLTDVITESLIDEFISEIIILINEILDASVSLKEKIV
jgi:ATP-dependent helicase/nuclease subunit B